MNSPYVINQVLWFYQDVLRDLIAIARDGHFIPTPAFIGRVQQTTNAGIRLSALTNADTANYSVEVWVMNGDGDINVWTASVYVLVTAIVTGN